MSIKDFEQERREAAEVYALRAEAVKACPKHPEVLIDQGDPDANSHAYAIATNACKSGSYRYDRQHLLNAVKDVIEQGAFECPVCEREHHA